MFRLTRHARTGMTLAIAATFLLACGGPAEEPAAGSASGAASKAAAPGGDTGAQAAPAVQVTYYYLPG